MRLLWIMTTFTLLSGCGYFMDNRNPLLISGNQIFRKSELTYATLKQAVFLRRCENCHNEGRPRHGVRLDTYAEVVKNLRGVVQTTLVAKTMPKGDSLTDREMAMLQAWIDAGAPEIAAGTPTDPAKPPAEKPAPTPEPLPQSADFEYIRGPLFKKHACYECHLKGQRAADVVIDQLPALLDPQYKAVVPGQPDESVLIRVLETEGRNRMPPISSGEGMSADEVKLIRDWITRGAPPIH